jgi:hypothetical protein
MPIDASVLRLCLVTDRGLARGRPLMQIVDAAVRGGVTMVQLREKAATTRAFLEEARALKSLLAPLGVPRKASLDTVFRQLRDERVRGADPSYSAFLRADPAAVPAPAPSSNDRCWRICRVASLTAIRCNGRVRRALRSVVCRIFCATANPIEVVVAETEKGRGLLGVIDGLSPKGIEAEDDVA